MEKMSLERFREVKEATTIIYYILDNLNEDKMQLVDDKIIFSDQNKQDIEKLIKYGDKDSIISEIDGMNVEGIEEIFQNISDEIHTSDLSDIPFEEYEGFYDFGFDFSGTKANIDFNIINTFLRDVPVRVKGCNVRNFDFDAMNYDGESFDVEFKTLYADRFLDIAPREGKQIPNDVERRYYAKNLEVADIIRYGLYDKIQEGRSSSRTTAFFEKVTPEIAQKIPSELFDHYELRNSILEEINNETGKLTEESINKIIASNVEKFLSSFSMNYKTYQEFINNPAIRKFIPERSQIDFGGNEELGDKYFYRDITIKDIYENPEVFRDKDFLTKFSMYEYRQEAYEGITEEKIYYFYDNFTDIAKEADLDEGYLYRFIRSIDLDASKEDNLKTIQIQCDDLLESRDGEYLLQDTKRILERYFSLELVRNRLTYSQSQFDSIMKYTSEDKIKEYGIPPRLFENNGALYLFYHYGLETVMEFDRANDHVFSKNDFALAKQMYEYYFHYAGNNHNLDTSIYYRETMPEEWDMPYSMKDFEECVRRMILYGPSDGNYARTQPIDFRNFGEQFKEDYPRMFLEEDAPQELQDKFYTKKLEVGDFKSHPEWIQYLEGKEFEVGVLPPKFYFEDTINYKSANFFDMLRNLSISESEILNFLTENSANIKLLERYTKMHSAIYALKIPFDEINNLEDLQTNFENSIEEKILTGQLEYGEPYIPDFFKEKHPEFVLDENAPEELKAKFYSLYYENGSTENTAKKYSFTIEDLSREEFRPFLQGKSFDLLRNADTVRNITNIFDFDTIISLNKIDPQAFELYCFNLETANALKDALAVYPELYAREELMQGQKLTEEEFTKRLEDEEFKSKFDELKQGYVEDLVKNPGFILHLEPEKRSRLALSQYKDLSSMNMLHNSNRFSRDSYEQILGHMMGFIGYDEAKRLLAVPEIDEETLSRVYAQDEVIKSLYEKKFEIIGNLKVIPKLFEGIPGLLPNGEKITSKGTLKLFMALNKKLQEGYDKDIRALLTEVLSENGAEIDSEKIDRLIDSVVAISTAQKLDQVREKNSVLIDQSLNENQKTKNMIKIHYRDALEYSLNKFERVDPDLVREYLEREFSRTKEDGSPYYSDHVTCHLEDLVRFASELTQDPEWSAKLNHSVVQDLKEESDKIGRGWIRKITSHLCYGKEKLTYEEAESLDSLVYPEGSGLEIDTKATIGLRDLSDEEKSKVYELLTTDDYRGLLTYGKAENMFSALNTPYSDKFREYFLKYKDEFIGKPDLFSKFVVIASKFETYLEDPGFNTRFREGTLTPDDILAKLSKDIYKNISPKRGEYEVFYQATQNGVRLTEDQIIIALRLFKDMQKREYQTIPQEQYENKHFRGRIVRMDDPIHFVIGEITNCCQTIGKGQPGESSMIHSATERNGSLFIVEELDDYGNPTRIVAQSWTWRNGNRVTFDNVEIPHQAEHDLKQTGGFDEIMEVYQETAKRMIETDRIKLKKLLEKGKITQEQYDAMLIKDVGMGTGCDDLVRNVSQEKRETLPRLDTVHPIEAGKTYTGAESRTLYYDSRNAILIAHNNDFAENDHAHTLEEVGDYDVQYVKTRDIFRRRGLDIDSDKIETISNMVKKTGRTDSAFSNDSTSIAEITNHFGIRDLSMVDADRVKISMSENGDWYVLYEETENGIVMLESGIDTTSPNGELEMQDRKMALGEYTREIYKIMLDASLKGKPMTIDSYSLKKFVDLDSLVSKDIISVSENAVEVKNQEKLIEVIGSYNKTIDAQRRERLTLSKDEKEDTEEVGK